MFHLIILNLSFPVYNADSSASGAIQGGEAEKGKNVVKPVVPIKEEEPETWSGSAYWL